MVSARLSALNWTLSIGLSRLVDDWVETFWDGDEAVPTVQDV
ncbi:MAG TPA: hypothetical protein VL134_06030 [Leptolyngbya sp.]|nr:hypothetical protein [Leptolyngbya sp.]